MCRWIAYRGETIALERYVTAPAHSLVMQSRHSYEGNVTVNGDGFGMGWYSPDIDIPGLFKEVRPAWADENLRHLARHIRSHMFFAHVRASTGTPTTRQNCHPFANGRWMFMHNGQLGDWSVLRRQVEGMISDKYYGDRIGTTDSEAMFLAMMSAGLESDPIAAVARVCETITELVRQSGTDEPLRFTAALANGRDLYGFRYSFNGSANTLYYRQAGEDVVIVSEPLDMDRAHWKPVPPGTMIVARQGRPATIEPFLSSVQAEAAE